MCCFIRLGRRSEEVNRSSFFYRVGFGGFFIALRVCMFVLEDVLFVREIEV